MPTLNIVYLFPLVALLCVIVQARFFQNPVLKNFHNPSVIKVSQFSYYMVNSDESEGNKIALHGSTDLQLWKPVGFVFSPENFPTWIDFSDFNVTNPEIRYIGGNYNIYYSAKSKTTGFNSVGVATSVNPTGPYKDIGKPLLEDVDANVNYPNIADDGMFFFFKATYI